MKRAILAVMVIISAVSLVIVTAAFRPRSATPPRVIKVTAKQFEFSPSQITVKKNEAVIIELTSTDREHGFRLRAFNVRADVKPGQPARVSFTPDKAGSFTFSCDVFCGSGHEDMEGTLVVTE